MKLGDTFPDFKAEVFSADGKKTINFHAWIGSSWAILFSHPADYTPVCTTELGRLTSMTDEFTKRNVKIIALSCDTVEDHKGWSKDILHCEGVKGDLPYPIIADKKRELAKKLNMIDPDEKTTDGLPLTCRAYFIISPDKKLKLFAYYPATTGRNFTEILRVVDSLQLTATRKLATPADWKRGEKCMITPGVSKEEADKQFPGYTTTSVPSGKSYIRMTPDPEDQKK